LFSKTCQWSAEALRKVTFVEMFLYNLNILCNLKILFIQPVLCSCIRRIYLYLNMWLRIIYHFNCNLIESMKLLVTREKQNMCEQNCRIKLKNMGQYLFIFKFIYLFWFRSMKRHMNNYLLQWSNIISNESQCNSSQSPSWVQRWLWIKCNSSSTQNGSLNMWRWSQNYFPSSLIKNIPGKNSSLRYYSSNKSVHTS